MPVAFRAEAIFQHETRDAFSGKILRVARALVRCEATVAAARADDDRRAVCRARGGKKRRERRDVGVRFSECAGRVAFPESNRFAGLRGEKRGACEDGEEERSEFHEVW